MIAKHAKWSKEEDIIFNLAERTQVAEKNLGKENVNIGELFSTMLINNE